MIGDQQASGKNDDKEDIVNGTEKLVYHYFGERCYQFHWRICYIHMCSSIVAMEYKL